uniref:Uncharacterized protein LOC113789174 n=1 Tax=Dermatophagoides pteronyssinus TaxID=6956 RepID=A0A6P6XM16_DERPT|nr:uncharacterized protein LOC113789174 [Dermatophagoides pteronyssinus]
MNIPKVLSPKKRLSPPPGSRKRSPKQRQKSLKSPATLTSQTSKTSSATLNNNNNNNNNKGGGGSLSTDKDKDKVTVIREVYRNKKGEPIVEKVKAHIVSTTGTKLSDKLAVEKDALIHNCIIYMLAQLLGIILIVLLGSLIVQYYGGFNNNGGNLFDNALSYHPMFMIITLILITSKRTINYCRLPFLITILTLLLISFIIIYKWHIMKRKIHLQTMHSWFGLITILIFTLYCIGNFYLFFKQIPLQTNKNNFLRPKKRQKFLKKLNQLLLLVRLLGLGCLIMAMITSIIGLNQYEDFYNGFQKSSSSLSDIEYNTSNPSSPKLLTNIVAIFLIIYCGFMSYLIARQRYRSSESIEFEQQVEQAVERAMKKMDAKGAFKSKNRTKRLSMRSDQSLSRIKSNGIQNFRSSGGGAFGINGNNKI